MKKLSDFLNEGVNDPAIFRAIFLAGGPGSGKSFIVGKTALQPLGFKLINSDPAFEAALKKAGLKPTPEDIASEKGQAVRARAKALTKKQMELAVKGRLGLIIDGTGKDYAKIEKQVNALRAIGYGVMMIFVNTDLDTALERNQMRDRSLPDDMVTDMWKDVQKNIGKFQNLFRNRMIIVDNSTGANYEAATNKAYGKIRAWAAGEVQNPIAQRWMKSQRKLREEHGAGEWGTDELTNNYKKDTPAEGKKKKIKFKEWNELDEETTMQLIQKIKSQTISKKKYAYAKDLAQKIYDRKSKEGGAQGPKHGIGYYAAQVAKQIPGVDARILSRMLTEDISQKQVNDLEKFADKLLNKFDVDVEFSRHFVDRLNDPRNKPEIKIAELQKLFKKIAQKKGKPITQLGPDIEAVLKDIDTDLNLPIAIKYKNGEFDVVHKTIMRKKNFTTPNDVVKL